MDAKTAQQYAKVAGALVLISIFAGGFAEVYVPGKLLASVPTLDPDVLKALAPGSRNTFTFSALTLYGYGGSVFMVFYGIATALRGYLVYRSGYLPRMLGSLLVLGGLGFIVKNFVTVLAPQYDTEFLLLPMFVAMIPLAGWLLLKGIDRDRWEQRCHPPKSRLAAGA